MPMIAIVEDSRTIRRFVALLLEHLYQVVEYETGPEALAAMADSVPDLVLLDISLPEMEGTVVLQNIRENPRLMKLPVIALTASTKPGDEEAYLAMGFDAYFTKPIVDEKEFFDEIARLLN